MNCQPQNDNKASLENLIKETDALRSDMIHELDKLNFEDINPFSPAHPVLDNPESHTQVEEFNHDIPWN